MRRRDAFERIRTGRGPARRFGARRLGVLALGAGLGLLLPRRPAPAQVAAPPPPEPPAAPIRPGVQAVRVGLGAIGVGGLVYAAYLYTATVNLHDIPAVLTWLIAAVILHDGILSPLAFGANVLLRRVGRRIPGVVLAIAQVAVIVGVVLTLIVAPEIKAASLGPANPTVVPFDYPLRLAITWLALIVLAVVTSLVVLRLRRRRPGHRGRRSETPAARHRLA